MMQQADRCQLFHPQKSEKDARPLQGRKEFSHSMLRDGLIARIYTKQTGSPAKFLTRGSPNQKETLVT